MEIIQNGLDFSLLEKTTGSNESQTGIIIPSDHKVFAVVGRLFPDKGHRYFIEAVTSLRKTYPKITGLIVGDGPSMEEIRQHIERVGQQENIILCGVRSDMNEIYKSIDCLVISSLREGLPYVLLEAMAHRVPVIATPVGDIPLLITEQKTGYIVPTEDVDTLEQKMKIIIEQPHEAKELAHAAYELVQKKYSARNMAVKTEELYSEI